MNAYTVVLHTLNEYILKHNEIKSFIIFCLSVSQLIQNNDKMRCFRKKSRPQENILRVGVKLSLSEWKHILFVTWARKQLGVRIRRQKVNGVIL